LEMQEVSVDAVPSVCSSSAAHPSAARITLSSSTPGVSYTWTLDKTSAPDVIAYSAPLQNEEAVVSADDPVTTTIIADALSLPSAVADAQTIEYKITPWHLGCPGKTLSAKVQVNPLPAVTPPADRRHCAGAAALAEPLTGTRGPNLFKWSGGGLAGLADQAEYGAAGLPDYTAAAVAEPTGALQVTILAKNANGCESDPVSFAISASPKPSLVLSDSRPLCSGTAPETAATAKIGVAPNFPDTKYTWSATVADNSRRRQQRSENCPSRRQPCDIPGRRKYGAGRRPCQADNRFPRQQCPDNFFPETCFNGLRRRDGGQPSAGVRPHIAGEYCQ